MEAMSPDDGGASCITSALWLVRHPRPRGGEGMCYGRRTDLDVAPDEVRRVAVRLAERVPAGWRLRSSPARRCRLLAEALLTLRPDLETGRDAVPARSPTSTPAQAGTTTGASVAATPTSVQAPVASRTPGTQPAPEPASGPEQPWPDWICPLLAEMNFGHWEGRPWAEIPVAELTAWTDDFADHVPGGQGESVRQFLHRVSQVLARAPAWGQPQGQAGEVWITHAGVIRAVSWLLAEGGRGQMPLAAQWPAFAVGYGEIWQMPPDDRRPR